MLDVFLSGVLPIFAIGAIGYWLGRNGTFDISMATAINRFAYYVAIPTLTFRMVVRAPIETFDFRILGGYLVTEIFLYGSAFLIGRFVFRVDVREAVLFGLTCALANHVLFVWPIAVALLGEAAAAPIVAFIAMDSLLVFGASIVLMEFLKPEAGTIGDILQKIVRNPPIIGMIAGLALSVSGFDAPKWLNTYLDFTAASAAPCALFALGIILSERQQQGRLAIPITLTGLKIVVHPLLAWVFVIGFLQVPATHTAPVMMVAAAPCGAMAFVLALTYGVRVHAIARAILYSTVGSLLTVTIAASL